MTDYTYKNGVKVMIGDRVTVRRFVLWKISGRIEYVPGISKHHTEMHFYGIDYVGFRGEDGSLAKLILDPKTHVVYGPKFENRDPSPVLGFAPACVTFEEDEDAKDDPRV